MSRRSLVAFESPNFGHAFLDGFEDLYSNNRDDIEDSDDDHSSSSSSRGHNRRNNHDNRGNRARSALYASDSQALRSHNGMREMSAEKRKDHQQAGDIPMSAFSKTMTGDPEPSLDDLLVSTPPEWTLCCVCHEIFKRPTSTLCDHTFCYDCIFEVINRKGTCPLCRHPIGFNEITENKQAKQAMSSLVVRCKYGLCLVSPPSRPIVSSSFSTQPPIASSSSSPFPSSSLPNQSNTLSSSVPSSPSFSSNSTPRVSSSPISIRNSASSSSDHAPTQARSLPSSLPSFMRTAADWALSMSGCTATFTLAQQASHEASCPHRPIACYNDGCNEKVKNKDLETHMEACHYRVVQCADCKETMLHSDEEAHAEKCPEKVVGCPNKCDATIRRKELQDHAPVCPNVEVPCLHAQYGCSFHGLRSTHEEHQAVCLYKGIATVLGNLTQQISHLTLANQNQAHTISMLQGEVRSLQTHVREQAAEIRSLREHHRSSRGFLQHDPYE